MTTLVRSTPGLDAPLTREDLLESAKRYTKLPTDDDLPDDQEPPPPELARLIASFGAQKIFGVHSVHSHGSPSEDSVVYGESSPSGPVRHWATPRRIDELEPQAMHGRLFAVTQNRKLQAYEFQAGAASDYSGLDLYPFLDDFVDYIANNKLWDIALEVLVPQISDETPLYEVIIGSPQDDGLGRAMVPEATLSALGGTQSRTTGWACDENNGATELKGNSHHVLKDGQHVIYSDGKLAKTLSDAAKIVEMWQIQTGKPE